MSAATPPDLEPKDPAQPRRYIVCYDNSPESRCAVEHAASLARLDPEDEILIVMGCQNESEQAAGLTALSGAKALALVYNSGVAVNTQAIISHDIPRTLSEVAREVEADYVIVGCRGTNLSRKFLGSVSKKITKLAPCPVILCRTNPQKIKKTTPKHSSDEGQVARS